MIKTFKYRVSEKEHVKPTTHNEKDFPLEGARLNWVWELFFQHALSGVIKECMTEQDDTLYDRMRVLCESMVTSDEQDWIEITCTDEEIEIIERCAEQDWQATLNRHIVLRDKEFPAHLAHLKEGLTNPDSAHLEYLKSHYDAYKLIVATRKEK